ncbi:MAG: pyridoxal-phosphate dependent enzyme [bacterium]|nr:pyridoxal-phosphate dependent enzyme [bacterium]
MSAVPNGGLVSLDDVRRAAETIRPYIHSTPVLTSTYFNSRFSADIFFKCENFQKVGAFKARGACNAVFTLDEPTAQRGVATHSSGNHAQAVAYAARLRGIAAYIVMPTSAPDVKRNAVRDYGAAIIDCDPTMASREQTLLDVIDRTGAHAIPPYNDKRVIAGQGTAALELINEVPDLDMIMTPVGGGGLMSGTAVAARGLRPQMEIIGVEPEIADDARRSLIVGNILPSGDPMTVADGLRGMLGEITFRHLVEHRVQIRTAGEVSIKAAVGLVLERMKIVVEPSAVVTIAALIEEPSFVLGKRIGIIVTGGNLDVGPLWIGS